MKQTLVIAAVAVMALMLAGNASAQVSSTVQTLTVTANNQGIFTFTLNVPSFNFGNVDSNDTGYGTPNVALGGRVGTHGVYTEAPGTVTWTCASAPVRTVHIDMLNTSTFAGPGLASADLLVSIPAASPNAGTPQGQKSIGLTQSLITAMSTGNGASTQTGHIDLELDVYDVDPTGAATWTLNLQATGV